jgi:hypothetical protein
MSSKRRKHFMTYPEKKMMVLSTEVKHMWESMIIVNFTIQTEASERT